MNNPVPCHRTLICYDMEVEKYTDNIQCICGFQCLETPDTISILDAFIFPALVDFMNYLAKLFGTVVLIAHNGYGYDHLFILEYLCTYKEVYSEFADFRLLEVGWGRAQLLFRDSKSYIPGKLADIASSLLNDKKLDCDLDNATIEELIIYCRQDALLVVKIMQYVQDNLLKANNLMSQPSVYFGQADIAYRIINANIDCFTLTLHDSIHDILSQCYYGGRVYSPIYGMRVKRPLCVIDIRSMYPASLCRPYPCGSIYFSTVEVVGKLGIYYIRARRPMPSCIKQTKAIVPVRAKDSILFASHGQIMGYYCSPDIEAMRLDGWDVEVLHGLVWTDSTLALRDKYNALYNERKKYPKDHPKNYAMKIILNSSYGKFCQIKSSNDSRPKYVGWFCLAYTRLQLYHLMKLSKDSIVYYGDTDCIIVSQDVLPVDKDMLRNELSLLPDDITVDVESMHNELIVLGKKSYALLDKNKVRVKGIPRASVDNVVAGWQGATKVPYLSKGSSAIKMTSKGTLAVDAHNLVDKQRTLKVNIPKEMIQCNDCKLWHTCEINMHA